MKVSLVAAALALVLVSVAGAQGKAQQAPGDSDKAEGQLRRQLETRARNWLTALGSATIRDCAKCKGAGTITDFDQWRRVITSTCPQCNGDKRHFEAQRYRAQYLKYLTPAFHDLPDYQQRLEQRFPETTAAEAKSSLVPKMTSVERADLVGLTHGVVRFKAPPAGPIRWVLAADSKGSENWCIWTEGVDGQWPDEEALQREAEARQQEAEARQQEAETRQREAEARQLEAKASEAPPLPPACVAVSTEVRDLIAAAVDQTQPVACLDHACSSGRSLVVSLALMVKPDPKKKIPEHLKSATIACLQAMTSQLGKSEPVTKTWDEVRFEYASTWQDDDDGNRMLRPVWTASIKLADPDTVQWANLGTEGGWKKFEVATAENPGFTLVGVADKPGKDSAPEVLADGQRSAVQGAIEKAAGSFSFRDARRSGRTLIVALQVDPQLDRSSIPEAVKATAIACMTELFPKVAGTPPTSPDCTRLRFEFQSEWQDVVRGERAWLPVWTASITTADIQQNRWENLNTEQAWKHFVEDMPAHDGLEQVKPEPR